MKRAAIALIPLLTLASSAFAEEAKKIDPATSGPTEAVTDKVPDEKAPASNKQEHPPTKAVDDAVPDMKPGDSSDATMPDKSQKSSNKEDPDDKPKVE